MKDSIPPWAKRLGLIGLAIVFLWKSLGKIVDAILEFEIQGVWENNVKPFLFASYNLDIAIPNWLLISLTLLVLFILVGSFVYWIKRPKRTVPRQLSPRALPPPKVGNTEHNNFRVIRAKREVEQMRLSSADFAIIVEQTINMGDLSKEKGAELLSVYNYELVLEIDGTVKAQRKRRKQ